MVLVVYLKAFLDRLSSYYIVSKYSQILVGENLKLFCGICAGG